MRFSLMFFAASDQDPQETCRTVLKATVCADALGLDGVWTPERHFDEFGGVFPHPALTNAALATATTTIQLRAGSQISPLHDTLRIAEDWSVVDNWSGGRAAVSFGAGWNANDFVLAPDRYATRHQVMLDQIDQVRDLWAGRAVTLRNGADRHVDVRLFPRPVQPELPMWMTSSGNPRTFQDAGTRNLNILTHLIGQDLDELAYKIDLYREAREEAGHDPDAGTVSLMLHTHLDESAPVAVQRSRQPFREYLRTAVKLELKAARGGGTISGGHALPEDDIPEDLMEELLDATYDRYLAGGSLIGSPSTCVDMVYRARAAGVDDIACLVDFGVTADSILSTVPHIAALADLCAHGMAQGSS